MYEYVVLIGLYDIPYVRYSTYYYCHARLARWKNPQFIRVWTKKAGYSLQRSHFFESQSWCHLFSHLFSHAIFSHVFSHIFSHMPIFSHLFSRSRAIVIFICLCGKVQRMILRNIPKDNTRMSINFLPIFPFLSYFASPVRLPVIAKYYREFPKSLFYDSNILPLTPGLPGQLAVVVM